MNWSSRYGCSDDNFSLKGRTDGSKECFEDVIGGMAGRKVQAES